MKYGFAEFFCKSVFLFVLSAAAFFPGATTAYAGITDNAYLKELINRAERKGLYMHPYWHTLLHYRRTLFGRKSLIDDPRYFLAENGKHDPRAEMKSTLRALFQPVEDERKHPICRFVARYDWLFKELEIDGARIPHKGCNAFNELVQSIKPVSVSLIFPTFHINNPASMFGHTLLRIDTTTRSKLLSYAVNYSAVTGRDAGPFYVLKGAFGGFKGYFSILLYYAKVAQYGDFDLRDIWEYPLTLSREEVIRMIMHISELDGVYSYYYFFDENCSYNLLFLLDAARPSLRLSERLDWWVLPVDTMRDAKNSSLINGVHYRPSGVTRIRHIASLLTPGHQSVSKALARGRVVDLKKAGIKTTEEDTRRIIDLATEYLKYLYSRGRVEKKEYQRRLLAILRMRSELGTVDKEKYAIPVPADPLTGHGPWRLRINAGFENKEIFQELVLRPAYHGLIDPDDGYIEGGQIIFTELAFGYYADERKLKFNRFDIVDIWSLTPVDRFIGAFSWKIKTGLYRRHINRDHAPVLYGLNLGAGFAYRPAGPFLLYVLAEPDGALGPDLENYYVAGAGGAAGILVKFLSRWKMHVFARDIYYPLGERYNLLELSAEQMIQISTNNALLIKASRQYIDAFALDSYTVGWNVYF